MHKLFVILTIFIFVSFQSNGKVTNLNLPNNSNEYVKVTTNKGSFTIQLFPMKAPQHVSNFKNLVARGFYNDLYIHHVIPGRIMQSGNPTLQGRATFNHVLNFEQNNRKHKKGSIGMVLQNNGTISGTEFYITMSQAPWLDGKSTVFGEIVGGIEVLAKIHKADRIRTIEYFNQ